MDSRRLLAAVLVAAVCGAGRGSAAPDTIRARMRAGAVLVGFRPGVG